MRECKIDLLTRCYGGGGGGSSAYERKGTGLHTKEKTVPGYVSDLVQQNAAGAVPDASLNTAQKGMFSSLISDSSSTPANSGVFTEIMNQPSSGYTGESALASIAAQDPFNGSYEAATDAAFKQRASDAMSQVATGPDAVRGGTARTGIAQGVMATRLANERGQEVRQAQHQQVGETLGASQMANSIEQALRGQSLQAGQGLVQSQLAQKGMGLDAAKAIDASKINNLQLLQLISGIVGKTVDTQTDDFSGTGDQSNWQAGLDCCFIFLQAQNGLLPWYINRARRDYYTQQRKRGYKWMSRWLVPMMQKSKVMQWLVNAVMVRPFLAYGAWLYKDESESWRGVVAASVCKAWLALWNYIGRR